MKFVILSVAVFLVISQAHSKDKNEIASRNKYVEPLAEPENLTPRKLRKIIRSFNNLTIDFPPTGRKKVPKSAGKTEHSQVNEHIIGGTDATRGQFPWQAALLLDRSYFCGGSLIASSWILTAAHCARRIRTFAITLGAQNRSSNAETGRLSISSNKSFIHPNYNTTTISNDVAVILLPKPVVMNQFINIVRLPKISDATKTFDGTSAIVTGWGLTADGGAISPTLKYLSVPVISNEECLKVFGSKYVIASTLCTSGAGTVGTCNGDSGGPLIYKEADGLWTQIGTVSFGAVKCVDVIPSAYARVTSFLGWISNTTKIAVRKN